ncbi:MAG: 2OG-Fe(II) oxygenase [Parvularculaceae bacterium]|nr:2OG-Fe(II) oxygenase [Parvularculaceae bacterium]
MRACKRCRPDRLAAGPIPDRVSAVDWERTIQALDADGFAPLGRLLTDEECAGLARSFSEAASFRSTVVMGRHGFGMGEYKYFADPLPETVEALRRELYRRLEPLASIWGRGLGREDRFPADHETYRAHCAAAGQTKPTPLLLSYGPGDFNRLHRDLYGDEIFPIQVAILLSEPGKDFEGGEFVLAEQRPRMQSRVHVVPLRKGDAVAFAVNERPVNGAKGVYRAAMRHGVSTVRRGRRMTLGVIFHDAP